MDYQKISNIGDWVFATAGCSLIWISISRLCFDETFSSMPRSVFIISAELLIMGTLMIFTGVQSLKLAELMNVLRLLIGKGLYCLFAAGFLDIALYGYSSFISIITLALLILGVVYIVCGIIFISTEVVAVCFFIMERMII